MKKIIAWLLLSALAFSLASCTGSQNTENTGERPADAVSAETETKKETAAQELPEGYYDVGDFTVFVPEGWTAIPVPDRDDPSKILTNDIQLAKDALYNEASKTWNTDGGASFYVTLLPQEDFDRAPSGREYYEKDFAVEDMEDRTIGSLTWHGFLVRPIGAPVYMMWAARTDGVGGYYTSVSTAYGMSLEDADLQAILGSLK